MKHNWIQDKPRKGWSTCSNCDLETKTYKIKKGGLPRCDPENALKAKVNCKNHMAGAISGARSCWGCGKMYSKAELEAGRRIMEKFIEEKASTQPENPPPIPI